MQWLGLQAVITRNDRTADKLTSRRSPARLGWSCKSFLLIEIILRSRYMFYLENYIVLSIMPKN